MEEQATNHFIRPDRQIDFNGTPHYEWPSSDHDRDTITVDRIHDESVAPSYRFVIKRGDTVEVFFNQKKKDVGQVVGISHAKNEVRVTFQEGSDGIWFNKGCIYPAPEPGPTPLKDPTSLTEVCDDVSVEPQGGFNEADRVPNTEPYLFEQHKATVHKLSDGTLTISELYSEFERMLGSKDAFTADLRSRFKADRLKYIASRLGDWNARTQNKQDNAASIFQKMLLDFHLGDSICYQLGRGTYEDAIREAVLSQTQEDLDDYFAKRKSAKEATEKALTDPATLLEFQTFIRNAGGIEKLTDQQLEKYDTLHAELTREERASEKPTTVEQFEGIQEGLTLSIKEGYHDRRKCPLWIVQLEERVERSVFNEMNRKAKMLGGWYSSFKKSDAGFQFLTEESANKFASLLNSNADRSDELEARSARKEQSAAERLHGLADSLHAKADEALASDETKLKNTERRARMAAGARGRAYQDISLANTIRSVATSLEEHSASFLSHIRTKTHVALLGLLLRRGRNNRNRILEKEAEQAGNPLSYQQREDARERRPVAADIRYAEYPFPSVYKRNLEDAILKVHKKKGCIQIARKMARRIQGEDTYIEFQEPHDIERLQDFTIRAKGADYDTEWLERSLENWKRVRAIGLYDIHELRSALREFLPHLSAEQTDNPVAVALDDLRGKKLPGFFPTPESVISEMLEHAELESHHRFLEPSAGAGHILDAVTEPFPDLDVTAIECNRSLEPVLTTKGYEVIFGDFLHHSGEYDRILMNPPFEKGADIDHVMHAYSLLAPGGRLVSVMSEGPFFRSDSKATSFREWLEESGATSKKLPENSFQGVEAFRETRVRIRLIVATQSYTV